MPSEASSTAAAGSFHVANPKGAGFSALLSTLVVFLESYGWWFLGLVVATSFLLPSFQRLAKKVEDGLYGEEHRKREQRLDKQREQVRKQQAEAFERRVREVSESRRSDLTVVEAERRRRLLEIEERERRLGLGKPGQRVGGAPRGEGVGMGGSCALPRHRPSGIARPRGGG